MVYLHFPSNLTEEETMLQAKYQKLKKKKKAVLALKAPKPEPEKTPALKRPAEARDAREVAKKLLKSGAISAIPKPAEKTEKTIFKRSAGLERKLSSSDRAPSGYQPFSASQGTMLTSDDVPNQDSKSKAKVPNLYENLMPNKESFGDSPSKSSSLTVSSPSPTKNDKPKSGHTIYVFGYSITEDILRRTFQSFGPIVNISMEIEKNCGFVTFEKTSSADRAISEMNGSMVSGIQLKVSLARRQPVIEPINDASSSTTWSTIAARNSQKGSYKDKRDLVTYEEDIF